MPSRSSKVYISEMLKNHTKAAKEQVVGETVESQASETSQPNPLYLVERLQMCSKRCGYWATVGQVILESHQELRRGNRFLLERNSNRYET